MLSGQISSRPHTTDFPPNGGLVREIPLFQGNPGSLGPKHFPVSEAVLAERLGGRRIMEVDTLRLEPSWGTVSHGQQVDVLVETVIWDPNGLKHLVRSALHRKFLRVVGDIPQAVAYSLMGFQVTMTSQGITLTKGPSSEVFPHEIANCDDLLTVSEACSGIGVMSDGLISSGACIVVKNELRQALIDFQQRQGITGLVQGDIGDGQVLSSFFHQHPRPTMIAAGFSCQPWSQLGDKHGFQDHRSSSLHHTLRTAYFCRSHAVLLECVTEAGADKAVIDVIRTWCRCTGFHMHSIELSLEQFWPSKRKRWWCLILSPAVQSFPLRALPVQSKAPVVSDLFPYFPEWPQEEEEQLSLDLYETNKFIEFNSLDRAIIKGNHPLATALHGWGNQLQGCPCGCRKTSMDHTRLSQRGIFGALVVMEGCLESCQGQLTRSRHLHPWELSVLTGAPPEKQWLPHLKLGICGLGQMASPIQSAWMYGQYHFEMGKQFGFDNIQSPEEYLWQHIQQVFDAFDKRFPKLFGEPSVEAFVTGTHDLLFASHSSQTIQPSLGLPDKRPTTVQAASTGESLVHDCMPLQEECSVVPIEDDGYADPDWECPFDDCCICAPQPSVAKPGFEAKEDVRIPIAEDPITPTVPFVSSESEAIPEPFTTTGGFVAFSSKRSHDGTQPPTMKKIKIVEPPSSEGFNHDKSTKAEDRQEGFSQKVQEHIWDQERLVATGVDSKQIPHSTGSNSDSHYVQVLYPFVNSPSFIKVKKDVTVGCIEVAESGYGNIIQPVRTNNIVGVKLPIASTTTPFQQLIMHYAPDFKHGPTEAGPNWPIDVTRRYARVELLLRQEGWVAQDEMSFYLTVLEKAGLGTAVTPFVVPHTDDKSKELGVGSDHLRDATACRSDRCCVVLSGEPDTSPGCFTFEAWAKSSATKTAEPQTLMSAMLVDHHWIPLVISTSTIGVKVHTTKQGIEMIQPFIGADVEFQEVYTPQKFHADCGFQTIGAIIQATTEASTGEVGLHKTFPVDSATAVVWRRMFEQHLFVAGQAKTLWWIDQLKLGGASGETPEAKLKDLLISHGVPIEAVDDRVTLAFARLGRPKIIQAIRANRPWHELKSISNALAPKLQLVLPSELQQVIQQRASQPKPFGDKTQKKNRPEPRAQVVLRPEDVSIPDGIFKQGQSDLVKQIPVQAIGPDACGIVVISANDAHPYVKLARPISKQGLGLLIMDHSSEICQGLGHVLRFPCKCEQNGEPVIATARLIQLGCVEVTRHFPDNIPSVDEVPTVVVRAVLYRDEVLEEWANIIDRPVRHVLRMLDLPHEEGLPKSILDVWDRQFLTIKMSKCKPQDSEMFIVSLRLNSRALDLAMQKSGHQGLYVEPRTPDGRQPSPEYRVVWLAKTDKGTAITALQTTTGSVSLARTGLRFGIRTGVNEAEAIHNQHKSHLPYLDTNAALRYMVGPFPYGATREAILKVFSSWGWSARPLQPKGRTGDGQGIQWEVIAATAPECEVYSLKHGDVILTLIDTKKPSDKAVHDVMASAKTMALLRQTSPKTINLTAADIDPLQQHDPWASYQPPKMAKTTGYAEPHPKNAQLDAITANVDRRLAETLAQVDKKLATSDAVMSDPSDDRIAAFEDRLQQLEGHLQQQQSVQQQHQQQVSLQFQQVQSQIEAQSSNFQSHLDQKMSEQLAQIELLLGKKQRRE